MPKILILINVFRPHGLNHRLHRFLSNKPTTSCFPGKIFVCGDKNSPYPSILVLSSGTGSARFSIKRFNCSLITARKLDCLLASRLCTFGLVLFSEQRSRDLGQVGRSSDGTLVHFK